MSDQAVVQQEAEWRGVAAEEIEEISHSTGLRLQARSRKLLGSLLRPHVERDQELAITNAALRPD